MEILFTAFVKATGWSIINSLWQGALIYVVLRFLFAFNKNLNASTKHNLSFIALIGILAWFGMTFYSEFNLWIELNKGQEHYYAPGHVFNGQFTASPPYMSFAQKAEQSFPILAFFYSAGLLIQAFMLLLGYLKVRQLRIKGLSDLPQDLLSQFSELSKKAGLSRMVKFSLSDRVNVPMVVGYFKPIVLIPLSILSNLDVLQLEAVIIHELSHIRRNDYLLNLVKISIETILFFNPFVWLCSRLIDTEREHACDDLVLQITGQPLIYASTLLKLEKMKQDQNVFSIAITGKKFHLLNRIKRITEMKTSALNNRVQLFSILILSAVVLSLAWIPVKESVKESVSEIEKEKESSSKVKEAEQTTSAELHLINNVIESLKSEQGILTIDTLKKQFKIMVEDELGKQVTYNSLDEMPEDLRFEFLNKNRKRFAMPVFHFGNGVKGFNGFTMQTAGDSTKINKINVNGQTLFTTKGINSADSARGDRFGLSFGDSLFIFSDTSRSFSSFANLNKNMKRLNEYAQGQNLTIATVENSNIVGEKLKSANVNQTKASAFTIIPSKTSGPSSGRTISIGSSGEGSPKERAALVKKVLENKENRDKIAKGLLRPSYMMNPSGQLEENVNSVFVFDDVALRAEEILRVIRPGVKNEYGIYIPTREEKIQKLIENPANKEQLRKIISESPVNTSKSLTMNGQIIYTFEETMVQKQDIIQYLQKNQKAKQSLLKD